MWFLPINQCFCNKKLSVRIVWKITSQKQFECLQTLEMLGKNREGFETPDECLQRILSKNDCSKSKHDDDVKDGEQ